MSLLLIASDAKTTLSKQQQTFNRLIKKVEKLQMRIKETTAELNDGLQYYYANIKPKEQQMLQALSECITVFYSYHLKPGSNLSRSQKEILKDLIASMLTHLTQHLLPSEINPEIKNIFEDIMEFDFEEEMAKEIDSLKEDITRFGSEQGINIDLSEINEKDTKEEIMAKFQKAFFNELEKNGREPKKEPFSKIKKKSQQQLKKEEKLKEIAEIQKKGLSTIYKQLAKALHPDLELDPSLKIEKEALMAKLTTAYDNQDLHTLLTLEINWMNRFSSTQTNRLLADEQLKIYNSILKDQTESLKNELDSLHLHARYFDLLQILEESHENSILDALSNKEQQLSGDIMRYSSAVKDLKGGSNFTRLKQILKEYSTPPEDDISLLLQMMFSH